MLVEDCIKGSARHGFLERTVQVWQTYSPVPLSELDAEEIIRNLTSFLDLLASWDSPKNRGSGDLLPLDSSSRVLGGGCDRPPGRPRQVRPNARGLTTLASVGLREHKAPGMRNCGPCTVRCYARARVTHAGMPRPHRSRSLPRAAPLQRKLPRRSAGKGGGMGQAKNQRGE